MLTASGKDITSLWVRHTDGAVTEVTVSDQTAITFPVGGGIHIQGPQSLTLANDQFVSLLFSEPQHSAVQDIEAEDERPSCFYTLDGRRVPDIQSAQRGIYLRRQGGVTTKYVKP